jgi:F-type H+-transporting ATPase subunit epsilon
MTEQMTIHLEIITPERVALSEDVDFVVAPGVDGQIGILPRHAPLLTRLGTGMLRVKKNGKEQFFAVASGFLEVSPGSKVSVFAETAEDAAEINVERARLAAEKAKERLANPKDLTAEEVAQLEASLARAIMRVKVSGWRKLPPASHN